METGCKYVSYLELARGKNWRPYTLKNLVIIPSFCTKEIIAKATQL